MDRHNKMEFGSQLNYLRKQTLLLAEKNFNLNFSSHYPGELTAYIGPPNLVVQIKRNESGNCTPNL